MGASLISVAGVTPCSTAAAYRKALKFDPGWRFACVARLNLESSNPIPPTSDRIAPSVGSRETRAAWARGTCARRHWRLLSSHLTLMRSPISSKSFGDAPADRVLFSVLYRLIFARSPRQSRRPISPCLVSRVAPSTSKPMTMAGGRSAITGISASAARHFCFKSLCDSSSKGGSCRSGPRHPCRWSYVMSPLSRASLAAVCMRLSTVVVTM